ncbi:hypothetical protein BUALT_Bualt05G0055200 [Buddleja alternifolia]|uniref:Uncharacterized protein n=1 Tax=Buddleja alternifolia TaxID=168488 RepID=A0AAV6XT97_9LAMI|nr:hypothetical protein BUALT_Bualt05G0055200 [Buddleja alternifolia]
MESIAMKPLLGQWPIHGSYSSNDVLSKRKPPNLPGMAFTELLCQNQRSFDASVPRLCFKQSIMSLIKSQAMELTKEAHSFMGKERTIRSFTDRIDTWPPKNKADNPSLNNPLLRQERMGCNWLGAIFEWEGVLIEDNSDLDKQAWLALSDEEGRKPPPPAFMLSRIEGMKNEQAISEVLCWSRDSSQLKRMAFRKEEILISLESGIYRFCSGSLEFVKVLMHYNIPMALVSTRPRKSLEKAIQAVRVEGIFNVILTAEDVYRGKPDPEMFVYAAELLGFIPERCIVFGNSNRTVEAAHDARMKCVGVASKHRVYELGAADLVVRRLDEISVVDLKNLSDIELREFGPGEAELEMEVEDEDDRGPPSSVGVDDGFW